MAARKTNLSVHIQTSARICVEKANDSKKKWTPFFLEYYNSHGNKNDQRRRRGQRDDAPSGKGLIAGRVDSATGGKRSPVAHPSLPEKRPSIFRVTLVPAFGQEFAGVTDTPKRLNLSRNVAIFTNAHTHTHIYTHARAQACDVGERGKLQRGREHPHAVNTVYRCFGETRIIVHHQGRLADGDILRSPCRTHINNTTPHTHTR